jgi:hypothetical protein
MTPSTLQRLADHLFQYSAALSPKDYEDRLREFNWPTAAPGRPLHMIPTSELLAELNARKERSPVAVQEIAGPTPASPKRWGIYRDGDTYRKGPDQALRQRYIAVCDNPTEARLLASMINDTDAARMQAAKE